MNLETFINEYHKRPQHLRRTELLKFVGLLLEERNAQKVRSVRTKSKGEKPKAKKESQSVGGLL